MTEAELARIRRDLEVSLALAVAGSPVRGPILSEMAAIDAELGRQRRMARHGEPITIYLCSCGFGTDDPDWFASHLHQRLGHEQRRMMGDTPRERADAVELPVRP